MSGNLVINAASPEGTPATIGIVDGVLDDAGHGAVVDADGLIAVPGFVDLQINGGFGHDFTSDPSSVWAVGSQLPGHGVTAFLPTIITADPGVVVEARRVLETGPPAGYRGAMPLGLHCEGPMISLENRGAIPPNGCPVSTSSPAGKASTGFAW